MHEKHEESQPEMAREIVNLLRPHYVILFFIGLLFVFVIFSSFSQQEEDTVDDVYEITHRVYLDVDVDKQRLGRIVIGLYNEVVPKTVENFCALCTGELGKSKSGKRLHYKGTPFHRIIPGFMIQGGDIVHGAGRGNESIYGGTFRNENFKIKQSHPGMVAMVGWGTHVVFGKVIEGMDNVYVIEGSAGTYSGEPRKKVVISDSGEIPKSEWNVETRSTKSES